MGQPLSLSLSTPPSLCYLLPSLAEGSIILSKSMSPFWAVLMQVISFKEERKTQKVCDGEKVISQLQV